jgi:hypothetical protein
MQWSILHLVFFHSNNINRKSIVANVVPADPAIFWIERTAKEIKRTQPGHILHSIIHNCKHFCKATHHFLTQNIFDKFGAMSESTSTGRVKNFVEFLKISQQMSEAFRRRMEQRRTDYSGVLQYLHTGSHDMESLGDHVFFLTPAKMTTTILNDLLNRLRPDDDWSESLVELELTKEVTSTNDIRKKRKHKQKTDLQVALNQTIDDAVSKSHTETLQHLQPTRTLSNTIKKEMSLFEAGGSIPRSSSSTRLRISEMYSSNQC